MEASNDVLKYTKFMHVDTNNPETDTPSGATLRFAIDRSKADLERGFRTAVLLFGASVTKVTSEEDKNIPKKLRLQRNRHSLATFPSFSQSRNIYLV